MEEAGPLSEVTKPTVDVGPRRGRRRAGTVPRAVAEQEAFHGGLLLCRWDQG